MSQQESRAHAKERLQRERLAKRQLVAIDRKNEKKYVKDTELYNKRLGAYLTAKTAYEAKKAQGMKVKFTRKVPVKPVKKERAPVYTPPPLNNPIQKKNIPIGYLRIFAVVASGLEGKRAAFNEFPNDIKQNDKKVRKLKTIPLNKPHSKKFALNVIKYQYDEKKLHDIIIKYTDAYYKLDNFYKGWYLVVSSSNLIKPENMKMLTKVSKSGRYQDIFNKKSYIKDKTFIDRYNVRGGVQKIPYTNYETNDVENYCVEEYVIKRYKGINKNLVKSMFHKEDVTIKDIKLFTDSYKIKCVLFNIAGRVIYNNKYENHTNYPFFAGIFCNNHFYPHVQTGPGFSDSITPKISTIVNDGESSYEMPDDDIFIEKKGSLMTPQGIFKENHMNDIDSALFNKLHPNFKYISEDPLKMKSLLFNNISNENINNQEFDLNKAYYTIAHDIIDKETPFPIFTCGEIYEKYNDESINDMYYYLISKESLTRLSCYGFITNSQPGFMINFLMTHKLIKLDDIEYYKKNTYIGSWGDFINRIDKLVVKKVGEYNPDGEETEEQYDERLKKFKSEYVLYNGILGCSYNDISKTIHNIKSSDIDLLNNYEDDDDQWEAYDLDEEYTSFKKDGARYARYRYLNNCNIYNHIISFCSLYLLKTLFAIKKRNPSCNLVKITTDSLSFSDDKKIIIPKAYAKHYKVVESEKRKNKSLEVTQQYYNGEEVINDTLKELRKLDGNVSYQGAPGTGKTYKVKKDHKFQHAATITNVCANNMKDENIQVKPTTVYSLLSLFRVENIHKNLKKYKNKTVWIDEFSMIQNYMWNYFFLMSTLYNTKFIFSGDINQIGPIGEDKIDINHIFFKSLFGETEVLKVNYRNDPEIVKLRDEVCFWEGTTYELHKKFCGLATKEKYTKYKRHLTFTHDTKCAVNEKILKVNGLRYSHIFNKSTLEYTGLVADEGVILCCKYSVKREGIYKGDLWLLTHEADPEDSKYIRCKNLNDGREQRFKQEHCKYFTLGFATTTHSSQGLTIDDKLCIHEAGLMIQTDKDILYTAITRTTAYENLKIYMDKKHTYEYNFKTGYQSREPRANIINNGKDEIDMEVDFDKSRFMKGTKCAKCNIL